MTISLRVNDASHTKPAISSSSKSLMIAMRLSLFAVVLIEDFGLATPKPTSRYTGAKSKSCFNKKLLAVGARARS